MKFSVVVQALASVLAAQPLLAADAPPPPPTAPVVLVNTLKAVALFDELSYPARVISRINANVLAESEGVVAKIKAPLGTKVRRGQTLMIIRHTDPVYQYAPLAVTTPVSGIVSQVEASEGSLVNKGDKLAAVTDPAAVRVTVEIAAADLGPVKAGLIGELSLSGRDKPVALRVRGVSPFVDPATGTATAELECVEKSLSLAPGLVGQVRFKVNEHKGFTLPEYAVVYREGKTLVRLVEKGKAKYVPVVLGPKARGSVEITSGVIAGVDVIERASAFIADGEAVTAKKAEGAEGGT